MSFRSLKDIGLQFLNTSIFTLLSFMKIKIVKTKLAFRLRQPLILTSTISYVIYLPLWWLVTGFDNLVLFFRLRKPIKYVGKSTSLSNQENEEAAERKWSPEVSNIVVNKIILWLLWKLLNLQFPLFFSTSKILFS